MGDIPLVGLVDEIHNRYGHRHDAHPIPLVAIEYVRDSLGDFYVLPSSVHEVLVVPKRADMDVKDLEHMVQEVNATQVAVEEQLSDHVYMYDAKEHEFLRADKAEAREQKSPEHESTNMEQGCMSMDGWSAGIERQKAEQSKSSVEKDRQVSMSKNKSGRE